MHIFPILQLTHDTTRQTNKLQNQGAPPSHHRREGPAGTTDLMVDGTIFENHGGLTSQKTKRRRHKKTKHMIGDTKQPDTEYYLLGIALSELSQVALYIPVQQAFIVVRFLCDPVGGLSEGSPNKYYH